MGTEKPNCTGKKFGRLTVLGKAEIVKDKIGRSRRLWLLQCDCGKQIKIPRGYFDRKGGHRVSCGCAKKDNSGVPPQNLKGLRFGHLVALKIIPDEKISLSDNSKVWLCQCDCGKLVKKSVKRLHASAGLHCGEKNEHHIPYANYPPAPSPYPKEAGEIAQKYFYLIESKYWKETDRKFFNSETQEERIERLLRAAWILAYKKQQGETFSELHEKRFIRKHLRYAQTDVYWRHKLEKSGGLAYDLLGNQKSIGSVMSSKKTVPNVRVGKGSPRGNCVLASDTPHSLKRSGLLSNISSRFQSGH